MEEREKGGERKGDEEFMGLKLKGGILVGKSRGGVCTPPPTWTFEPQFQNQDPHHPSDNHITNKTHFSIGSVSARQLGANLWEVSPHLHSLARMSHHHNHHLKGGGRFSKIGSRHRNEISSAQKNKGLEIQAVLEEELNDTHSDEQPVSTGSFHRQIAASLMQHHRSVDRSCRALQPVSPATYSSSMEVTPYNRAATPSSSIEYQGRAGDPSYSLKTSSELLKVLNRIWCLEEQHASNISLVKSLKMELDNARTRIKELLRDKQMDRQVIDDLMKKVAEHKHVKKNTEQDRVQSVRDELEGERKLRRRSESLHRKLAREISEMKSSFSKALSELERERKARVLLEDLCDEFAMGIRDYEHELRSSKFGTQKEQVHREHVDGLILHISETWLDERVQMKLAEELRKNAGENSMVVDKLRPEIETFLKARQALASRETVDSPPNAKNSKGSGFRRQSLESYPLNEATSAPQNVDDEEEDDDSTDSDSHCFELSKNLTGEYSNGIHTNNISYYEEEERDPEETSNMDTMKRDSQEVNNGRNLLQARFEKHMAKVSLSDGKSKKDGGTVDETNTSHKSSNRETIVEEGLLERRSKRFHMLDNLLRNNSSSIEGERIHPVSDLADDSHGHFLLAGPSSPVKKWESKISSQDSEIFKSSSRWPKSSSKENTLKAKLLEARLEARNSQQKGSTVSS